VLQNKGKINQANLQGRIPELDVIRGLAVLFMVVIHVNSTFVCERIMIENPLFRFLTTAIGDVAIAFMFIMGAGTVLSKSNSPARLAFRGLKIFLFGYVFNFVRNFVPAVIGGWLGKTTLIEGYHHYYEMVIHVDIFQFAGLALMFIGLIRALKIPPVVELIIGCVISFSTVFMSLTPTSLSFFPSFSNLLKEMVVGGWLHIYFPFVSWIVFPVAGAFFARVLLWTKNKNQMYIGLFRWAFLSYVLGWGFLLYFFPELDFFGWHAFMSFYRQTFTGNLFFLSEVCLLISGTYFVLRCELVPKTVLSFIAFWSKNITALYIVSWLIINWTACVVTGFNTVNSPLIAIGSTIICIVLTHLIIKYVPLISVIARKLF